MSDTLISHKLCGKALQSFYAVDCQLLSLALLKAQGERLHITDETAQHGSVKSHPMIVLYISDGYGFTPASAPPVLALAAAIVTQGNTTAEWLNVMASLIPFRLAIRWAVTGQEMSKRLSSELKDISDGLYVFLPPPYRKGVGRAVVE